MGRVRPVVKQQDQSNFKMVLYTWNDLFELVNPDDAWVLENPNEVHASIPVKILKFIPKNSYVKTKKGRIVCTRINYHQGEERTSLYGLGLNGYYRNIIYGMQSMSIKQIFIPTLHIIIIQRAWRKYFLKKIKVRNDLIVHGLAMYFGHPSRICFDL